MSTPTFRPCRVRTVDGLEVLPDKYADGRFHQWYTHAWVDDGLPGSRLLGVIELNDGQVITVAPADIQFTDREVPSEQRKSKGKAKGR